MSDNYFRPEEPTGEKNTNFFREETKGSSLLSDMVFKETVERYAVKSGKSYEEAYKDVVREGPENIFLSDYTTPQVDIIGRAAENNFDYNTLLEEQNKYNQNVKTVLESKDSADIAKDLTEDDILRDPLWKQTVIMDRVRKGFSNAMPQEGIVGSVTSFAGALASEMTVGAILDAFNTAGFNVGREARGREAYDLLMNAKSIDEVDSIVADLVQYAKEYGYTGTGNPMLMTSELVSILSAGESQYPVFNTALNVLTSGTIWKGVGMVGDAVTARKAANAVDYVDMAAAVKGTEGGNQAAAVALKTEGTSARVSDHAEYDAMRIIKTSPDSAVDVTVKPTDAFEKAKDIETSLIQKKSFIEDISRRFKNDDVAAADEISRVVKEKLADYAKVTDTAIANVTVDYIEKAVPIRKVELVKTVVAPTGKKKKPVPDTAYANEKLYDKAIKYMINVPDDAKFSVTDLAKSLGFTKREEAFPFISRMRAEKIISSADRKLVNTFKEASKLKKPKEIAVEEPKTIETEVVTEEPIQVPITGEPVFNVEEDILNNRFASAIFVKSDGTLFKNREDATKVVSTYGQGEVVETTNGFYIKYRNSISLKDSAPATKAGSGIKSFYYEQEAIRSLGPILNYTSRGKQTTSKFLQSSYIMGMKKSAAVLSEYSDLLKNSFLKLSREDQDGIDDVLTYLRDEDSFARNSFYDETEFAIKFAELTKGKVATQKVVEAYNDLVKFYNTVNLIQADKALKTVNTNNGFNATFKNGLEYVVYRTEKKPEFVYDVDLGRTIKRDEIGNRPVFEVYDDAGFKTNKGYAKFVVGAIEKSRPVTHTDVYGFTPGSSRVIDDFNFIAVQDNIISDISGETRFARPKTPLLAKAKVEADKAVTEIETLRKAFSDPNVTDEVFEELVKKNNGFDPAFVSASTVKTGKEAFKEWMDSHSLSMDTPLKVVSRKDAIDVKSIEDDFLYEDALFKNLNPVSGRKDRISYGYGNGSLYKSKTALQTLPRMWASSMHYLGRRDYEKIAIEGFLKGAEQAGVIIGKSPSKNRNLLDQLVNTEINTKTIQGRKFAVEQQVLKDRLAVDRETTVFSYDSLLNYTGEKLLTATLSKKIPEFVKNSRLFKGMREYSTSDIQSRDPYAFIRGLTFHPNFGVLNPDSIIMQASGVLNAMTRTNPAEAVRAVSLYKVVRGALINPTKENIKELYRRSVAANLVSDERELTELITYLKDSGWMQIHDNVALGSPNSIKVTTGARYWGMFDKISASGFREGNIFNHIVSANIAYREFRAIPKNAKLDITKGTGKTEFERFMSYRIEDLSGSMSMASAAKWQKGLPSLALQYMSQPIRLTEDMFLGRLNPGERTYFLAQQLALFGAAGTVPTAVGASYLFDAMYASEDTAMDRDLYTTVRWGGLDYTLSNLIGEYTAMSNRLGSGVAILDAFRNVMQGKFLEVVAGPSGNIYSNWWETGTDPFVSTFNALVTYANTGNMHWGLVADDFERALRNTIRTADVGMRSYYLYKFNEYTTKNGDKVGTKYPSVTALTNMLGIPLQDVTLSFDTYRLKKEADNYVIKAGKDIERLHKARVEALQNNNIKEYAQYSREIEALMLPLDEREKDRIRNNNILDKDYTAKSVDYIIRTLGSQSARQLQNSIEKAKELQ